MEGFETLRLKNLEHDATLREIQGMKSYDRTLLVLRVCIWGQVIFTSIYWLVFLTDWLKGE